MTAASTTQSLFTHRIEAAGIGSQEPTVAQVVQKFEGLLWNEVLQAMSNVQLGPSGLGYAGQVYQRMLWQKIASQDFAQTDQGLTRATLDQLLPAGNTQSASPDPGPANSSAPGTAAGGTSSPSSPGQWVRNVWSAIKAGARQLGVPAAGLLAQAALETGWGQHVNGHNMFGVKAHGNGASFTALTHEFDGSVLRQVHAAFQGYSSTTHAVDDFVQLLQRYHPQVVGQSTVAGYAQALQASGYATDPRYAAKILAIAHSARMRALLTQVKESMATANTTSS